MSSLNDKFRQLKKQILAGRELDHASYEPIYYLIFSPKNILEVRRHLPAWETQLQKEGWKVYQFSIAKAIDDILENASLMKIWISADKKDPSNWEKTNKSLGGYITDDALENRLKAQLHEIEDVKNAILLVTDLEALHPYVRIGVIESGLIGEFKRPTVFLYPGESTGKTNLKFLGFYPEDGNYRSVHIG